MNKIKILIVVRWPVGGIRTYLRYVYNNFDSNIYDITLIAPNLPETQVVLLDLKKHKINYVPLNMVPTAFEITKKVLKILSVERYNIIHSHGLTAGLSSIVPSLVYSVPNLVTIHDVFTAKQFNGIKGLLKKTLLILTMPLITKIHIVSEDAKTNLINYITSLKYMKSKTVSIINGIEVERFASNRIAQIRKNLNLNENVFIIGYFGRFMSQKGFKYLVDAMYKIYNGYSELPKPILLTFGNGEFKREEQDYVNKKGLDSVIYFLPFESNIAPILKEIDLVVMPSLWEACGLLAMESMVAGVPLICSDCIGLREVVDRTPCRTVPIKNSDVLAEAIICELSSPTKIIAKQFVPEAIQRYDVKIHSQKIQNLICSIIKGQ